ncbi:MAG: hypothetical protein U0T82_01015 [Bacteroidales bacterium]
MAWDAAVASDEPIKKFEICAGGKKLGELKHEPQTGKKPFLFMGIKKGKEYSLVTVDRVGRRGKAGLLTA